MADDKYQYLAGELLDLWQKQMGSVVRDKQFIEAMLNNLRNFQPEQFNAKRASKPADAADDVHDKLVELTFRLSACERRLASLESGRGGKPAKPGRAGKAKPGRAKGSKKPR